jgi:hypothetical protein
LGRKENYQIKLLNCDKFEIDLDCDKSIDYENYILINRLTKTSIMFYLYIEKINETHLRQNSKKAPKKIAEVSEKERIYNEIEIFDNSDSETDEEMGKNYFLFIFLNMELKYSSFRK